MVFRFTLCILCSFFGLCQLYGQSTKGMYVNDFKHIIGNAEKEEALLSYAQKEGFNYLLLYNLTSIHRQQFDLSQKSSSKPLADFIARAKTQYGILEVGAVGEKRSSFDKIITYNNNYKDEPQKQFDRLNIEFEFWNKKLVDAYYCENYLLPRGLACTTDGAFEYFLGELKSIDRLCEKWDLKSETYIGSPKPDQCKAIGANCDRVLVHFYRKSDVYKNGHSLYNFKTERLQHLAPAEGQLKVLPIFAANEKFMGNWLRQHNTDKAFDTFMNGSAAYRATNEDWKAHIAIDGFQWYASAWLLENTVKRSEKNRNKSVGERPLTEKTKAAFGEWFSYTSDGQLKIHGPAHAAVSIINTSGELVTELDETRLVDFSSYPKGVYLICIQLEDRLIIKKMLHR